MRVSLGGVAGLGAARRSLFYHPIGHLRYAAVLGLMEREKARRTLVVWRSSTR